MKLGVKITLIVVAAIVIAVIIGVSIVAGIAGRVNDETVPVEALSAWQSAIKDETLLKNVAIPGSHDAGTDGMPWYSKTQSREIDDQLACGTRYFDLRIKVKNGEARIYHGPAVSLYLKDILKDVSDFLTAHPSESVILDFQDFDKDDAKTKSLELIDEYLTGKIVANDTQKTDMEFIDALTIGEIRGKCLIFWGKNDGIAQSDNRVFQRNDNTGSRANSCMHSYYTQKWNWYYSSKKYIDKALPAYIDMYKQQGGGLFVLQGQLTDGMLIRGPRYREATHEKNMNDYVVLLSESEDLSYINIVMRDFVSPMKNTYTLILNISKGIVKDECKSDYAAMISATVTDYVAQ